MTKLRNTIALQPQACRNATTPLIWATLCAIVASNPVLAADNAIEIYPDDVPNPTVPVVPTTPGGANGRYLQVPATFTYPMSSLIEFASGGQLTVALRGGFERLPQVLVNLRDGEHTLAITASNAEQGRRLSLVWSEKQKAVKTVATDITLSPQWTTASLAWKGRTANLKIGAKTFTVDLPAAFVPNRVSVLANRVDELQVRGNGQIRLDWERGYAALATPPVATSGVTLRPQGFDAYYVSMQSNRRDRPTLQVLNSASNAFRATVRYSMKSEVGQKSLTWTQDIQAPARSSVLIPVQFSQPLTSDVYHLRIECTQGNLKFAEDKHFLYVERRAEPAGPPKFGLHDSNRDVFGFWPDALPVHLAHHYVRWGYVVGPAWIKDSTGKYGVDPDTPSEEWFWNTRLDWSIAQGLTPFVCIGGEAMLDWMREKRYERMDKRDWGEIGGKVNERRYRDFVRTLAQRYKGKVRMYEIQNEPNSHPAGGILPEDYVEMLKAAYEEIHAVDPEAQIFGISGTGDFVSWMTKVFELGGHRYMDGVSIHTYTTPKLPEAAGLPAKIEQVRALIAQYKPSLVFLNSETGTYVAPREEVDRPIAPERLTELITKGESPTLSVSKGWPNYALDEVTGSLSIARNATYNLAAGAKQFVFFGWNPKWPNEDWWTRRDYGGWQLISATKDAKERTPNLYALAVGVVAAQLEPVVTGSGTPVDVAGIRGAVFRTAAGGSTAVVWSTSGSHTAVFNLNGQNQNTAEAVSLFGQPVALRASQTARGMVRLELNEQPTYLHLKQGTLSIQPAPIGDVNVLRNPNGRYLLQYNLVNRNEQPWKGAIEYQAPSGWKVEPARSTFELAAGQNSQLSVTVIPPSNASGTRTVTARLQTPDGDPYTASFLVKVRPTLSIAPTTNPTILTYDQITTPALPINRPEQVVIGRPPSLASLQEPKYWQGPDELSASVKTAYSANGLNVSVRVHDANFRPPHPWPAVTGSAVELFFDFRGLNNGLGSPLYGKGVYQIILKPPATNSEEVQVWYPRGADGNLPGVQASGERIGDKDYVLNLFLPWQAVGVTPTPGLQFGMDVSVDGPTATATGRKTQMALFGTSANSSDASEFGHAVLGAAK
jgi:hypothetical protein